MSIGGVWLRFLSRLCDEQSQVRSSAIQVVATPGQEAADIDCGLGALVAAHGAVALLDTPADAGPGAVVGPVDDLTFRAYSGAMEGQARPEVPAVQESKRIRFSLLCRYSASVLPTVERSLVHAEVDNLAGFGIMAMWPGHLVGAALIV